MAKKKKHPNLPNGYGTIRKLSGNRRNPYSVHPPVTEFTVDGKPVMKKALCYVSDWYVGFAVLTAYKAGTYKPGMEKELEIMRAMEEDDLHVFTKRILADYTIATRPEATKQGTLTFAELYQQYYDWKYNGKRKYAEQSKYANKAAFKNCKSIHNMRIDEITYDQMQELVDLCDLKFSSVSNMVSLMKQMYKYALAKFMVDKDPTLLLKVRIANDCEHGVPFSETDIETLWKHENDDVAQVLLILCYSGFRIMELQAITVNLHDMYFHGGLKNRTSKERFVPIHSAIQHLVKYRLEHYNALLPMTYTTFRKKLDDYLPSLGINEKHTSHDCRHTFSMLCEKYKVSNNDRKRLMGHTFQDVTNDVYGHRELEELRKEIEKIPSHKCVANGKATQNQKSQEK